MALQQRAAARQRRLEPDAGTPNVRSGQEEEEQPEPGVNKAKDEGHKNSHASHDRFHDRPPQRRIHEFRDFLEPFENPIQIVKRNEVEAHRPGG